MAVIRVNKTDNYTVMSNYHLRDVNLTLKAKGLLSQMLSLPPTWDYTIAGLVAINKEKESAITSALKELKANGYLQVTKIMPNKENGGRIEYVYDIFEQPNQSVKIQVAEKQGIEKQGVENQGLENQGQISIDESNKDISNTYQKNKDKEKENIPCRNIKETEKAIVEYLNEKAGTRFKASSRITQQHIHARLEEGFTLEDFKTVIDKKCAEWIGTDFAQYLRPVTLFGTKFEAYLNAPVYQRKQYGTSGIEIKTPENDDLAGIL